jgi:hypothetical protein
MGVAMIDKRWAKRKPTEQDMMLARIIASNNPKIKRELITRYNPFHYIFGTALVRIKQEDLLTDVNEGDNNE